VKSNCSFANGNSNGNLTFKIRENNDESDFKNSVDQIKTDIKNKMGLSSSTSDEESKNH
jgi:hypothetical protein